MVISSLCNQSFSVVCVISVPHLRKPHSSSAGSVYVKVNNPLQSKRGKLLPLTKIRQKKERHTMQREIPASTVYTNPEWKQYSFVILSGRCRSSVGVGGAGARLPLQPLFWLALQTGSSDPLIGCRATWSPRLAEEERERGSLQSPSLGESQ